MWQQTSKSCPCKTWKMAETESQSYVEGDWLCGADEEEAVAAACLENGMDGVPTGSTSCHCGGLDDFDETDSPKGWWDEKNNGWWDEKDGWWDEEDLSTGDEGSATGADETNALPWEWDHEPGSSAEGDDSDEIQVMVIDREGDEKNCTYESLYREGPQIGSGCFGEVRLVWKKGTRQRYAAKIATEETSVTSLLWEVDLLHRLSGTPGFTEVFFSELVRPDQAVMVMELLGENLSNLQLRYGPCFTLKTVLMIADQVLKRVEDLHACCLIHCDIKPENFMVGLGENASTIYLIDLGLASEYCDCVTNAHIPLAKDIEFVGNAEYASARALGGFEQSRRDDLEAVAYMLIRLLVGHLPWDPKENEAVGEEWFDDAAKQKSLLPVPMICQGCPKEFEQFLKYCRKLKFDAEPDYDHLRQLFRGLFEREEFQDDGRFDWTE
mmetsp:Transcript_69237/g.166025  ORF Transcript_69237/g.166025 Transcript_69237/m.166025 type:complete len:439 (-) Transcript_69237:34-1350(-)